MNILGCVSLSEEARHHWVSGLESDLKIFDWLQVGRWELPATTIVCAVNALDRVDVQRGVKTARLVLGSARRRLERPSEPGEAFAAAADRFLASLQGELYLGFTSHVDGRCALGVDPLGLFPLYYASTPDRLVFSSSVWPFSQPPGDSPELDLDGLIGILLTQGVVGGRTLLRGVTRLSAGQALTWKPGEGAAEHPVNRLRPTSTLFDVTFDDQLDALDSALRAATTRPESDALLLSGGLDSRLLAGYLSTTHPRDFQAVSLGAAWQFDPAFAEKVARCLGWQHRSIDVETSRFLEHAVRQVRHEQLAGSFWDLAFWQLAGDLHSQDPVLVTGFCGNNALEPLRHDPGQTVFSYEKVFASCNKYGFSPEALRTLLRAPDGAGRIAAVVDDLRTEFDAYECEPFQKVLMFDLSHRARFLVGTVVWRLSFGTQPVLPYADPDLLAVALALPMTAFRGRKLQRELLRRRFPNLARLPLDTATYFTRPLLPTLGDRVRHWFLLAYHWLLSPREHRYYHAVFDLNSPGWRAVRAEAEKSRSKVETILDGHTLGEILPPPDTEIRTGSADFFKVGSRQKSLLALMLWASTRF